MPTRLVRRNARPILRLQRDHQMKTTDVEMTTDEAKRIYREAIDATAGNAHGEDWWAAVAREMRDVCAAASIAAAADVIEWWHHDWSTVHDTAKAAAKRIRAAAKKPATRGGAAASGAGRRPAPSQAPSELSEAGFAMLRTAIDTARQFQCSSLQALRGRLQASHPGCEAAIAEALAHWGAHLRERHPNGIPTS